MEDETPFKGSQLETEIRNSNLEKLKTLHKLTIIAAENQPNSIFWKEALESINKKM